jgi:hypothetical protein
MGNEKHYRALEKMYASAPCNLYYKPTMRISYNNADSSHPDPLDHQADPSGAL